MQTNVEWELWAGRGGGGLGLGLLLVLVAGGAMGWCAGPRFCESKSGFLEALKTSQVLTQDFQSFPSGVEMSGVTLLPGVYAASSFSNLVTYYNGTLFGYDNNTRIMGTGCYMLHLTTNYNAVGFEVMSWDPGAPGPARVLVGLADGRTFEAERWQTGASESTPVFFGVIAEQSIVRIEWHEGPEIFGYGNEEVSLDNLLCARTLDGNAVLAGIWEPDVYTGDAARLRIRQEGSEWFVQGWGAGSPSLTDWGEVPLRRVRPSNAGAFDGWFAVWEFDFGWTYAWIALAGQSLKVETVDTFSDGSGREPYSVLSWMHSVTPPALTVTRSAVDGLVRLHLEAAGGVELQRCTDLCLADWVSVALPAGTSEYVIVEEGTQRFFRVVKME